MSWRVGMSGLFYGKGKSEYVDLASYTAEKNAYSDILVDGSWQWVFSSKYILNLNVGFGNTSEESTSYSDGVKNVMAKRSYSQIGLDLGYLVSKDMSFGLNYFLLLLPVNRCLL